MDDIFPQFFERYISNIGKASTEAAKSFLFIEFVRKTFENVNVDLLDRLYPDLERWITKGAGVELRGRADAILGNLIIEFKIDLNRQRDETIEQLTRYLSILWTTQGINRIKYLVMGSDGIKFDVYQPETDKEAGEIIDPKDIKLEPLQIDVDISKLGADKAYVWLDRYILYSTKLPPRGDVFSERFGLDSLAYRKSTIILRHGWEKAKLKSGAGYEEWRKYLRFVYGSDLASEELFLKHTYLANLAKLMVFMYYTDEIPSRTELMDALNGKMFEQWGVINFIEEDFFSWVIKEGVDDVGFDLASILVQVLETFDISSIDEDILKDVYQELVDPEERHDLGEYYTPEWLATIIVKRVLKEDPNKCVLDPACGSGTFLGATIREKRQALSQIEPSDLIDHIRDNVMGLDIHPLAVIISKANYLMALGDLLKQRRGGITIPVYMANSIDPPTEIIDQLHDEKSYIMDTGSRARLRIPIEVTETPGLLDRTVRALTRYASQSTDIKSMSKSSFEVILNEEASELMENSRKERISQILFETSRNLRYLIEEGKDTVYGFIMRNIYRPLFFSKQRFDVLVGNPPWLSFRFIDDTSYQEKIKELTKLYGIFPSAALITQMEMGTLFLLRTADLYLEEHGTICFVMPRSIFVADQHDQFRKGAGGCGFEYLADLDVNPLFEVPACIVEAVRGKEMKYPVKGQIIEGKLPRKNTTLEESKQFLSFENTSFTLNSIGKRSFITDETETFDLREGPSYYYKDFYNGATIYPRSLVFIEIHPHRMLGLNPNKPSIRTSDRAIKRATGKYKDIILSENVESRFLYRTITGSEVIPFGNLELQLVVLPIESIKTGYRIIKKQEAVRRGFTGLATWLTNSEKEWNTKRGEKAIKMDLYKQLDYQNKLTKQDPKIKFIVVYNASGTYLNACVLAQGKDVLEFGEQKIEFGPVVVDCTTFLYQTNNEAEAYYLTSVLNSPILDRLLKPLQARGKFGPRHLHKKPLEFPIPNYGKSNATHKRLSELGKECANKVIPISRELSAKYKSIGKIRSEIRKALSTELQEIDILVEGLFAPEK